MDSEMKGEVAQVPAARKDPRRCFKCGRDLGPQLEWKKMETQSGPICYVCFNQTSTADATG
jgi:hypothetical protein